MFDSTIDPDTLPDPAFADLSIIDVFTIIDAIARDPELAADYR